jgi:hypothetical protein
MQTILFMQLSKINLYNFLRFCVSSTYYVRYYSYNINNTFMARLKKSTSHYEVAVTRLAGLKSISPTVDLGNGLTAVAYEASINNLRQKLETYNTTLSVADSQRNSVQDAEKALRDLSERMLTGVASKHGKNSDEYEKAGGVRKSERKKPVKVKKAV